MIFHAHRTGWKATKLLFVIKYFGRYRGVGPLLFPGILTESQYGMKLKQTSTLGMSGHHVEKALQRRVFHITRLA